MDLDDKTPGRKSPNDDDAAEWKVWGFVVGLVPAGFMLAAMSQRMEGGMKDSTEKWLLVATIICLVVAGFLFAKAAPEREREAPLLQVIHVLAVALGFAVLDLGIACVGCTCQAMHKL